MKKILSIALAVCMLASVLVMPASATLPTSTTQPRLVFSENFSNADAWDETSSGMKTSEYGTGSAANVSEGVLSLGFGDYNDAFDMDSLTMSSEFGYVTAAGWGTGSKDAKLSDEMGPRPTKWTMVFDVQALENANGFGIAIRSGEGYKNAAIAGGATGAGSNPKNNLDRYATLLFNPQPIDATEWYTYKVTVDEGNRDYQNATSNLYDKLAPRTQVWRKAQGADDSDYELLTCGAVGSAADYSWIAGAQDVYSIGFVMSAEHAWANSDYVDAELYNEVSVTDASWKANLEYWDAKYNFDNVEFYNNEPNVYKGVLASYDMENTVIEGPGISTVKEGSNTVIKLDRGVATVPYTNCYMPATPNGSDLTREFVISVDLKNEVGGRSFCISVNGPFNNSGAMKRDSGAILIKGTADNKWYNYKIKATMSGTGEKETLRYVVYRKEIGSNEPYTDKLVEWTDWRYAAAAWGTTPSNFNELELRLSHLLCSDGKDDTTGVWYCDNLQILDKDAIAGDITKSGSTYTANLKVDSIWANMTPIIAVYDSSDRLVDMGYATATNTSAGDLTITVDVDSLADKKVMLYIWDTLKTAEPLRRLDSQFDGTWKYGDSTYIYTALDITNLF